MKDEYPALATVGRRKANIQIIPLIDVVFFLLATFVLFTLSLNKLLSLPATLPKADGEGKSDAIVLQVTDAGVFWDKDFITDKELPPRLAEYVKTTKTPRVLLAGDEQAKYGRTVAALDELRKAGIDEVCFETAPRKTGN